MQIKTQKDNPLLSRKEVVAEIIVAGPAPKRSEATEKLASALKISPDTITMRSVKMAFGGAKAVIIADVYKNAEDKKNFEAKRFRIKGQPRTGKK